MIGPLISERQRERVEGYMIPAMQLTWGVLVGHESMPPARWLGFALIWLALAVFTADAVRRTRVDRRSSESSSVSDLRRC